MKLITRNNAKKQQVKYFFTGKPCKHGHISERYTSNQLCVECSKQDSLKRWNDIKGSSKFKGDGPYCPLIITSRKEAVVQGLEYYFTGTECKHGHVSPRKTSNHTCVDCQYEAYTEHKEKYKKIQSVRRIKKKDEIKEYLSMRWQRRKHLPEEKAYRAAESKRNKATKNATDARRRAYKLQATPRWYEQDNIKQLYGDRLTITNKTNTMHHVHHIIPLQECKDVCGLHCEDNLIILTEDEHKFIHSSEERLKSLWY
jgi:hypothetical protein